MKHQTLTCWLTLTLLLALSTCVAIMGAGNVAYFLRHQDVPHLLSGGFLLAGSFILTLLACWYLARNIQHLI